MSTEDELRRVQDAVDDLQTTMSAHTSVLLGCTTTLMGIIVLITANNPFSLVAGLVVLILGGIVVFRAMNLNILAAKSKIMRQKNRINNIPSIHNH